VTASRDAGPVNSVGVRVFPGLPVGGQTGANGWPLWLFDHAKETHFALLGANGKLQCAACHRVFPVKEGIPSLMPEPSKGS